MDEFDLEAERWRIQLNHLEAIRKSLAFLVAVTMISAISALLYGVIVTTDGGSSGFQR